MKSWDIFISYASEDRDCVAVPLAQALQQVGLKVWLDRQQMQIGDSLREKIDEGLARSCFGVIVLSEHFFAKSWPRRELNGLVAIEESGRKLILPVWHGVDKAMVATHSPILADRVAADTARGIAHVAAEIANAVFRPSSGGPVPPSLSRRFLELLDTQPSSSVILSFLTAHPDVPRKALAYLPGALLRWKPALGDSAPELAVGAIRSTDGGWDWVLLNLSCLSSDLFLAACKPIPELAETVRHLERLRVWIEQNSDGARDILPGLGPDFRGIVVAGRRYRLLANQKECLRHYNKRLSGITVRTYDWLVEAAASR